MGRSCYFPPSDPQWAGADSLELLAQVNQLIKQKGWQIANIDNVIVAERPKLKPYLHSIIESLSNKLDISGEQISVKATTNEKLGAVGRQEAICVYSVALLQKKTR